jgi:hypothetical protein
MTMWIWLLLSCLLAYAWKLLGYLVPASVLRDPRMSRIAGTMTIGLLASLTIVNTVAAGQTLALDARLGALAAAGLALVFRAPFLVVVLAGAGAAAGLRRLGWGSPPRCLPPYCSVTVFSPYLPSRPRGSIRV